MTNKYEFLEDENNNFPFEKGQMVWLDVVGGDDVVGGLKAVQLDGNGQIAWVEVWLDPEKITAIIPSQNLQRINGYEKGKSKANKDE